MTLIKVPVAEILPIEVPVVRQSPVPVKVERTGPKGDKGRGIARITAQPDGSLVVQYTEGDPDVVALPILDREEIQEDALGELDGLNAVFTSSYPFVVETLKVYANGILLRRPEDYINVGDQTIQLKFSPAPTEIISLIYNKYN